MKTKLIIIAAVIGFTTNVFAQRNSFYKHMEGQISNNIFLVIDLIGINKQVSGSYYYYYFEEGTDSSLAHYGKTMPVNGSIDQENRVTFTEFKLNSLGAIYSGQFIDEHRIAGSWQNPEDTKVLPFEIRETYEGGSMAFIVYHLEESAPLLDAKDAPTATLQLSLLLPVEFENPAVSDSIHESILQNFFGKDIDRDTPLEMLNSEMNKYFHNYKKSNRDLYDGGASFSWEKIKSMNVHYNKNYILSLENFDYGYTGGAHGMPISKLTVFDLTTGLMITLDDIFRPEYENDLRDILNAALRKKYELGPNASLKDAGFFYHDADPSRNFYLNKDGLEFYYNRYEIAPFAMGSINVFIPFEKLRRIMIKSSPVYRLLK